MSPTGDVKADCQCRRSATWTPSLTLFEVPPLQTFCCVRGVFNFDKSDLDYSYIFIEKKLLN